MKFQIVVDSNSRELVLTPENAGDKILLGALRTRGHGSEDSQDAVSARVTFALNGRQPYQTVDKVTISL